MANNFSYVSLTDTPKSVSGYSAQLIANGQALEIRPIGFDNNQPKTGSSFQIRFKKEHSATAWDIIANIAEALQRAGDDGCRPRVRMFKPEYVIDRESNTLMIDEIKELPYSVVQWLVKTIDGEFKKAKIAPASFDQMPSAVTGSYYITYTEGPGAELRFARLSVHDKITSFEELQDQTPGANPFDAAYHVGNLTPGNPALNAAPPAADPKLYNLYYAASQPENWQTKIVKVMTEPKTSGDDYHEEIEVIAATSNFTKDHVNALWASIASEGLKHQFDNEGRLNIYHPDMTPFRLTMGRLDNSHSNSENDLTTFARKYVTWFFREKANAVRPANAIPTVRTAAYSSQPPIS